MLAHAILSPSSLHKGRQSNSWVPKGIVLMFSDYMLNLHAAKSDTSAERALVEARSAGILDLEEALKPPDLEDAFGNHDAHLENAPPLDTSVGALGGVAVGALTHDDVALLVLDLGEEFGELLDCLFGTTVSL